LADAGPGLLYGYRVYGPFAPEQVHRFNSHKLLLDPYARDFFGDFAWSERHYGYPLGAEEVDLAFDDSDSAPVMPKCRVIDEYFDWEDVRPPGLGLADTIIYEVHVKGFTQRHPGIPKDLRGTYAGLAHPAAIDYLQALGVTAVELLPVQAFLDEPSLAADGLHNYWGYNSIGFFAPMARYASDPDNAPAEFKGMVKALHRAGIEVILDVVYNHTAEGDQLGPTLSFRGLDNMSYYRLTPDAPRYYINDSGCGNTLDAVHPRVLQLIMDSLRYWAGEMHVDGFRFDLAPCLARREAGFDPRAPFLAAIGQDPLLAPCKLIAEPWDVGPGGYQVGQFPPGWSEWNDRFRDNARAFWLQQALGPAALAPGLAGSSDLFAHNGRRPQASINMVTAHDGFTLADLVSYAHKHNEANGHDNSDGSDHNLSINNGVEGETDDPEISALRSRLKRNLLATALLAQGVPMLLAGDECGHSQGGNNNAYCQDNETTWLDWAHMDTTLLAFTRRLIALRQAHPGLRRTAWLVGEHNGDENKDVTWLNRYGTEKTAAQWEDCAHQCFGMLLAPVGDESFLLVLINAGADAIDYTLPDGRWALLLDTARVDVPDDEQAIDAPSYVLAERSLALFRGLD
jgi:glycogen operon protein